MSFVAPNALILGDVRLGIDTSVWYSARLSGEALQASNPAAYAEYKASSPSKWLIFQEVISIDGQKLAAATAAPTRTPVQQAVVDANVTGNRQTLKVDSFIPATMAVIYLLMLCYFKSIGGYRPLTIAEK